MAMADSVFCHGNVQMFLLRLLTFPFMYEDEASSPTARLAASLTYEASLSGSDSSLLIGSLASITRSYRPQSSFLVQERDRQAPSWSAGSLGPLAKRVLLAKSLQLLSITRSDTTKQVSLVLTKVKTVFGRSTAAPWALKQWAFVVCSTEVSWSEATYPVEFPCADFFVPFGLGGLRWLPKKA